ncbi:hypothetical protein CPT_Premi_045 [Proteus phage Premi]|uniref:Uncharacterized protein n=1 Tax=Proteus phage Premi TaxID=3097470 RepID=A0ABZ0ZXK9_9CAUD|nr:hypothetical protein CPT_Premi_045 [Proteus phage Premi]
MANNYSDSPITGKVVRKQEQPIATHLMVPVVADASVKKSKDVINDATKSGKQQGAMLGSQVEDKLQLYIAVGSKEVDNWNPVSVDDAGMISPV